MLKFLASRTFLRVVGLLLFAVFLWYAGPLLTVGFDPAVYQPLASAFARLLVIALAGLVLMLSPVVGWWRARRASARLAGAVVQTSPAQPPSDEVDRLRRQFEAAVETLNAGAARGRSLYDLPWYAFIGPPGSGKTTALVNSGLKFPLEQRGGRMAVRGVGGTRNCDWWFTDAAVFLDTAGRYTTQDSDPGADSEGWREFLALLARYRKRRPLNGLILTISALDLLTTEPAGLDSHVDTFLRRLGEFVRELPVQLPVYVMVTKCDMVAGFADYFEDLTADERAQVWGVTFDYGKSLSGSAAASFAGEFDALLARVTDQLFTRVEETHGGRRRGGVFAFPQQLAALRAPLSHLLSEVFAARALTGQVLLRGVYFTSGTQDGTQIDRLMGAIGRRLGIAPDAAEPLPGRGKAYFVDRLLREVVIGESGLAGVNRALERRQALWQFGAYAAIALAVIGGVLALSASYARNRAYVAVVAGDVAALRRLPAPATGARVESLLPRLNAIAAVVDSAERYRSDVPLMMRWGLYQGRSLGNAARDAYVRELDSLLLPEFAARVQAHLREYAGDPDRLYVYLKGYLMLGQPQHLDRDHLQLLVDFEWPPPPGGASSVSSHFARLLDGRDGLRPVALDGVLVAQAQSALNRASMAQIMYGWLRRDALTDETRGLRFDLEAGVGIEKVLRRRSNTRIADPFPRLYTKEEFQQVTSTRMLEYVRQFGAESWVWGTSRTLGPSQIGALNEQVTELYERDYIRAWTEWLQDLAVVPFTSVPQYAEALSILVGPTSPLRGLLATVVKHTSLVEVAPATATPSIGSRITKGAQDLLRSTAQKVTGSSGVAAGSRVTAAFQPIHRMMAGSPAPIDALFEQTRKIRDQLQKVGAQVGGSDALRALSDPTLLELRRGLQQDARNLPAPLDTWFGEIATYTATTLAVEATDTLLARYRGAVVHACHTRLDGRYPFASETAGDLSLGDFAQLFGPGGVYDRFFTEQLQPLVDTTRQPWDWRPESVNRPDGLLAQFERADRIKRMFFSGTGKEPKLAFTAVASDLDSAATGFFLSVDGQILRAKPGTPTQLAMEWPGASAPGVLRATFEDRVAAPVDLHTLGGPWGLFRLIDASAAVSESDRETVLQLRSPHHQIRLRLVAPNPAANPFGSREWRQFACES